MRQKMCCCTEANYKVKPSQTSVLLCHVHSLAKPPSYATLLGVRQAFLSHERLLSSQISAGAHVQIIGDNQLALLKSKC